MKAVVVRQFGDPSVLRIEDVPDPAAGAGEVVVRVRAAGVNPVETYLRSGTYTRRPDLPWTPGTDGAGEVVAVGEGVSHVSVGERVYTTGSLTGTYAELCLCRESQARPLPERLSFAQGAAIHVPYATAWRALLQKAKAQRGETVLVHGATGGVGLAAVELALARGCVVAGTGGTPQGRAKVKELGAGCVVDHTSPGHLDEVAAFTGGRGPDVILEMLADRNLDADLGAVAMRGRVVVIGSRGRVDVEPRRAMTRDVTVLGMSLHNATDVELAEAHDGLARGFESGALTPFVREEVPLGQAARAHETVIAPGALGKVVLVP
jgi:NADPH2:quinone reductase